MSPAQLEPNPVCESGSEGLDRREVLWLLDTYWEEVGNDGDTYLRVTCAKSPTPKYPLTFLDHDQIYTDIHGRHAFRIKVDPGFRLDQWMAANDFIRTRWPAEAAHHFPDRLVWAVRRAVDHRNHDH